MDDNSKYENGETAIGEKTKALNHGRKLEFQLNDDGHVLRVRYTLGRNRNRHVSFRFSWPDSDADDFLAFKQLIVAADDIRKGQPVDERMRDWIAACLESLGLGIDPYNTNKKPQFAHAFAGLPLKKGRPNTKRWQLFHAIDSELGRKLGNTEEEAHTEVAVYWDLEVGTIEKEHQQWLKTAKLIVAAWIEDDERQGIALKDSIADHRESIREQIWKAPNFGKGAKFEEL